MYADDHADLVRGLARQFRSIARAPVLDPEDLSLVFATLRSELAAAEAAAVANLRAQGHSWEAISRPLGISRQAAFQKWGSPPAEADGAVPHSGA